MAVPTGALISKLLPTFYPSHRQTNRQPVYTFIIWGAIWGDIYYLLFDPRSDPRSVRGFDLMHPKGSELADYRDSATSSSQAALEQTFDFQRPTLLGSRPAPAPLSKRPAEAHRAVSSASRYRFGRSLCRPGAAKPAAKPAAAANSAAMDSNRRAWSVFPWLSTAVATASAGGAAEVVNIRTLWFALSVLTLVLV